MPTYIVEVELKEQRFVEVDAPNEETARRIAESCAIGMSQPHPHTPGVLRFFNDPRSYVKSKKKVLQVPEGQAWDPPLFLTQFGEITGRE